jgi:diguanylate cyclase (GGDEF)-like protein
MADLPHRARAYVIAVITLAMAALIASLVISPPRLERLPVAALLLLAAVVAQQFKAKSPKHQSYYTTTIFFFAAALLLRPAYVAAIIVVVHASELITVRYRWYIPAFNSANFLLSSVVAGSIFGLSPGTSSGLAVLYAVLAGLVFVSLNHLLTALVITYARNVPISKTGTLDWENLGTDLALVWVGALGAFSWLSNPWLVPLALGPLFLIYRSLLVPSLKEEARTDPKTELVNMKHWNEVAHVEIDRARRFHRPLAVILADLDLLRDINNTYGHLVGDQMIRRVAQEIRTSLREYDLPARFGGDEFAILMPETSLPEALTVAERIRAGVEAIELRASDGTRTLVSLSIGVALFPGNGMSAAELLASADRAVYQAKAAGRNRVCAFTEPQDHKLRALRPNQSGFQPSRPAPVGSVAVRSGRA